MKLEAWAGGWKRIIGWAMALVLVAGGAAHGQLAPGSGGTAGPTTRADGTLQLLGNDSELFAVRTGWAGLGGQEQSRVSRRPVSTGKWKVESQVVGRARNVTMWRGQLVLQMEDGSWRMCFDGGSTPGTELPEGNELIALAGEGERMTAVVRRGDRSRAMDLQGGTWVDAGALPEGALATSAIRLRGKIEVLAREGEVTALYEGTEESAPAATTASTTRPATRGTTRAANVTWTRAATLPPISKGSILIDVGGDLGVWVREPAVTGSLLLRSAGFDLARRIDLGPERGAMGVAGGRLRVVYAGADAPELWEQAYDLGGNKLGKPEPAVIGQGTADEKLEQVVQGIAVAAAMGGLLLAWKRRADMSAATLAASAKLPVAPWYVRLASGTVDAIPWLAVGVYLAVSEKQGLAEIITSPRSIYLTLVGAAAVSMHTLVGELMFGGRSVGKMLFGLKVVTMDGGTPKPADVLGRCLLKMPVMVLPVFWLSLAISPLRQGLWDAATGTVVVLANAPAKKPEAADDE